MSVTQASLLGDTFGSKASGTIPIGGIIMWSGSVASVPTGWSICNGENGTPNLVDRFIVGAGSGYAVAATGGSADATLVSHSHTGSTDIGGVHNHTFSAILQVGGNFVLDGGNDAVFNPSTGTTSNHNGHQHTFTTSTEGSSATNANLPPYYALAFIMRVS
jgi:hypothetical protein